MSKTNQALLGALAILAACAAGAAVVYYYYTQLPAPQRSVATNAPPAKVAPALERAAERGDLNEVKALVAHGADVDGQGQQGWGERQCRGFQ
jgi:hypothetical protein